MTEPLYERDVTWRARYRAFIYAGRGVVTLLATQWNARIHLVATVGVVALGFICQLAPWEWCSIILVSALVWVAEALNTAIEFIVDLVSPQRQKLAGQAKDLAAGAVLLATLAAVAVGLIVFLPHFRRLLQFP